MELTIIAIQPHFNTWIVYAESAEGFEYFCTFPGGKEPSRNDIDFAMKNNWFQLL